LIMPPQERQPRKPSSNAVSPARREAFAILIELDRGDAHADTLLRGSRVTALSPQDRNLCTSLVMSTLRWQIRLDSLIKPLLTKPNARLDPEIRIALRLGALQLLFLDRIPAHAAIGESVALAKTAGHKFASGMVNAVLRKLAASPRPALIPPARLAPKELAEATAHPVCLVERWVTSYGSESARDICLHGQQQPELTIRLSWKDSQEQEAELAEQGIRLEPGALLTSARRVVSRDVTATAAFESGRIRFQDEGSQLIAELAGHGASILDCCAAPGGKTLILAERNPQARITACELNPARFAALRQRITEAEAQNPALIDRIHLMQADAAELSADIDLVSGYDLILADVPCSGTGTLGRNPEIRHRLEPADLARHHQRQCAILHGALRAGTQLRSSEDVLLPTRVLYSTCSLEPEENAAVVAEVLAQAPDWQQISLANPICELASEGRLTPSGAELLQTCIQADGSLMLLPGKRGVEAQTDGFFIAMLEKRP
jgi:16S rRNA (cytosine967-C5)-methyltransferase